MNSSKKRREREPQDIRSLLTDELDRIEELYEYGDGQRGRWGIAPLEELAEPPRTRQFIVAGSSRGADTLQLLLSVAAYAALHERRDVTFISPTEEADVMTRLLSLTAGVATDRIQTGKLAEDDWARISDAVGRLGQVTLNILRATPKGLAVGKVPQFEVPTDGLLAVDLGRYADSPKAIARICESLLPSLARLVGLTVIAGVGLPRRSNEANQRSMLAGDLDQLRELAPGADWFVALPPSETDALIGSVRFKGDIKIQAVAAGYETAWVDSTNASAAEPSSDSDGPDEASGHEQPALVEGAEDEPPPASEPTMAAEKLSGRARAAQILEHLEKSIVGQSAILERVALRLGAAVSGLRCSRGRPLAVLLLAGPSGVGKTTMARELATCVFDNPEALIRLDMSEYASSWSLSRLLGPPPGYLGHNAPDSWLTTRLHERPRCVVLLDEFEKADPAIWNAFLAPFDGDPLTDGRGRSVDFSGTVIVMTSNLGSSNFTKRGAGFVLPGAAARCDGVMADVERALPPELLSRIDEVFVFSPLSRESVQTIAEREVDVIVNSVRASGYDLIVPAEVSAFLAERGHDPALGVRALHRAVERHLIERLLPLRPGRYVAHLVNDDVDWVLQPPRRDGQADRDGETDAA